MDLQITHQDNIFQLVGTLNKFNIHHFKKEFSNVFEKQNSLTLNIENLTSIDRYGVIALTQLRNQSLVKGKKLSIIGVGSDDLYEHFKSEESAA